MQKFTFIVLAAASGFLGVIFIGALNVAGHGTVTAISGIPVNGDMLGFLAVAAIAFCIAFISIAVRKE